MQRYKLRVLVAVLTFFFGVSVFKAINFLEDSFVEHFSTANISSISVPTTDALESNEIYKVILRQFDDANVKLLVVQSESQGYVISAEESLPKDLDQQEAFSRTVRRFMPEADTETLENYLSANKMSGPLTISAPDLNIALIARPDYSDDLGWFWEKFYKTYPNSSGLIHLSQVGFNNRHDQAFVYVARSCGGLCGGGSYILLGKTNGRWIVLREEGLWVS